MQHPSSSSLCHANLLPLLLFVSCLTFEVAFVGLVQSRRASCSDDRREDINCSTAGGRHSYFLLHFRCRFFFYSCTVSFSFV
jgi:hypothetical protein